MSKQTELAKLIEVDATYGEITMETAKRAAHESKGASVGLLLLFIAATIVTPLGVGFLLASCPAVGSSLVLGGLFCIYGARVSARDMHHYDAIVLAYTQRDHLRELRGDNIEYAIDTGRSSPKRMKLKR